MKPLIDPDDEEPAAEPLADPYITAVGATVTETYTRQYYVEVSGSSATLYVLQITDYTASYAVSAYIDVPGQYSAYDPSTGITVTGTDVVRVTIRYTSTNGNSTFYVYADVNGEVPVYEEEPIPEPPAGS